MFRVLSFKQTHQKNCQKFVGIELKIVKIHQTKHIQSMSVCGLIKLKIDTDVNNTWIFIVNGEEKKREEEEGERERERAQMRKMDFDTQIEERERE